MINLVVSPASSWRLPGSEAVQAQGNAGLKVAVPWEALLVVANAVAPGVALRLQTTWQEQEGNLST